MRNKSFASCEEEVSLFLVCCLRHHHVCLSFCLHLVLLCSVFSTFLRAREENQELEGCRCWSDSFVVFSFLSSHFIITYTSNREETVSVTLLFCWRMMSSIGMRSTLLKLEKSILRVRILSDPLETFLSFFYLILSISRRFFLFSTWKSLQTFSWLNDCFAVSFNVCFLQYLSPSIFGPCLALWSLHLFYSHLLDASLSIFQVHREPRCGQTCPQRKRFKEDQVGNWR